MGSEKFKQGVLFPWQPPSLPPADKRNFVFPILESFIAVAPVSKKELDAGTELSLQGTHIYLKARISMPSLTMERNTSALFYYFRIYIAVPHSYSALKKKKKDLHATCKNVLACQYHKCSQVDW
ncbi:hypothetical protein CEXT_594131 [Caerostris extrusa]|uniref:Uncharacterized protein n=1 Tax=Caerostris extrusa TaxID=172846 RepID=A0AAV4T3R5_CAEEX|nr:hypothetical protein CEXT_594131 [Caerostris extrusa]